MALWRQCKEVDVAAADASRRGPPGLEEGGSVEEDLGALLLQGLLEAAEEQGHGSAQILDVVGLGGRGKLPADVNKWSIKPAKRR